MKTTPEIRRQKRLEELRAQIEKARRGETKFVCKPIKFQSDEDVIKSTLPGLWDLLKKRGAFKT